MNVFRKIINRFIIKSFGENWITNRNILGEDFISNQGGDKYKSYAFACINLRAENVAAARINMYQDLANGKTKEIFAHPFLDLIKRENGKKQTFANLLYRVSASLDLYGNAYLFINRDITSRKAIPFELYYLPFKQVQLKSNPDQTMIEKYIYSAGGNITEYPANDIIHFQVPDPNSNLFGIGMINGCEDSIDIDFLQRRFQKNYFKNNASVGLALETSNKLSDLEFKRLKDEIKEQYEGVNKAGKTMLLENGLTAKQITNSPKDSMLVAGRQLVRDDILSMFRVPKTLLGLSDDVNLANALIALQMFTNYTIKPFAKLNIRDKINSFLSLNYEGKNIRIELDYDTETDRDLTLKTYEIYLKYGVATTEEIREMEGFDSTQNIKN